MPVIWIDAQLSPAVAIWLPELLELPAFPLRELELRDADDIEIFRRGTIDHAIILTKDADFQLPLDRPGPPPRMVWLACRHTSNQTLRTIMTRHAAPLRALLAGSDALIEIG